jgi:trehalose 6-phosphate synthase
VLVHDLSFVERREATTRNLLLSPSSCSRSSPSLVTLVAARYAWRGWTRRAARACGGGAREFQPSCATCASWSIAWRTERRPRGARGTWSPERLRETLKQHLQGERVVILANREPYIHERDETACACCTPRAAW